MSEKTINALLEHVKTSNEQSTASHAESIRGLRSSAASAMYVSALLLVQLGINAHVARGVMSRSGESFALTFIALTSILVAISATIAIVATVRARRATAASQQRKDASDAMLTNLHLSLQARRGTGEDSEG